MDNNLLKRMQSVELSILIDIDRFCNEHDIKYSIYAGTALGAVRHGGFIPWDDDVDIAMTRTEFDRFCQTWKKTPMQGYYLESIVTDNKCGTCHAKVRKEGTILLSKGEIECKGHHGIWVDIFPLDKISFKKKVREEKFKCGRKLIILTRANVNNTSDGIKKKIIRCLVRIIPENIRAKMTLSAYQWLVDHSEDGLEGGFDWHSMSTLENISKISFPSDLDSSYTNISFEGRKFMVFSDYKEMLKCTYGDYMQLPPESERVCRHMPVKIQF